MSAVSGISPSTPGLQEQGSMWTPGPDSGSPAPAQKREGRDYRFVPCRCSAFVLFGPLYDLFGG